ncbi:hypothetical protein [[Clostridium] polysaccharolyticum]|jgi:hypothetical protein|uniref:hypothetical protein n=1 Tax=[Clostridium] polysaccharolyticum TaxID=29364 RepID=UPI000B82455D|nr:hypothetical protein [[Clostridium] polysaccharolyticum]
MTHLTVFFHDKAGTFHCRQENQPRLYEDISLYFKEGVLPAEKKAMAKKGCYSLNKIGATKIS